MVRLVLVRDLKGKPADPRSQQIVAVRSSMAHKALDGAQAYMADQANWHHTSAAIVAVLSTAQARRVGLAIEVRK